jgi:hypothetical protein
MPSEIGPVPPWAARPPAWENSAGGLTGRGTTDSADRGVARRAAAKIFFISTTHWFSSLSRNGALPAASPVVAPVPNES